MWYRVFLPTTAEPVPAALAEFLHARGFAVEPHFKGDAHGWTEGELRRPTGSPVLLARYLTKEDDLRDDLNAHAAELETMDHSPHSAGLMERVIQTKQLITLRKPADATDDALPDDVCRFLATSADGVYQVDSRGWFAADGELLIHEH